MDHRRQAKPPRMDAPVKPEHDGVRRGRRRPASKGPRLRTVPA
jgi:hypothetical protein